MHREKQRSMIELQKMLMICQRAKKQKLSNETKKEIGEKLTYSVLEHKGEKNFKDCMTVTAKIKGGSCCDL